MHESTVTICKCLRTILKCDRNVVHRSEQWWGFLVARKNIHQGGPCFGYFRIFTLIWFEINKNNIPQVSSLYLNFNLCHTAMQVSHLNNMRFLALTDQFFIPAKKIVQKIWNFVNFIFIIVAILRNFNRFSAIIILESITY